MQGLEVQAREIQTRNRVKGFNCEDNRLLEQLVPVGLTPLPALRALTLHEMIETICFRSKGNSLGNVFWPEHCRRSD